MTDGLGATEGLIRAEMRVVDEAQFDLPPEILGDQGAEEPQAESVLQRSPEPLDQGDGALPSYRSEALLHSEPPEPAAEGLR